MWGGEAVIQERLMPYGYEYYLFVNIEHGIQDSSRRVAGGSDGLRHPAAKQGSCLQTFMMCPTVLRGTLHTWPLPAPTHFSRVNESSPEHGV